MKQEQHKEQWINEVMASVEGMERPDANPFLYEKIKYRMEQGSNVRHSFNRTSVVGWAAAVVMLLAINGVSIVNKISREKHTLHTEAYNAIAPEMQTQTIYNY